MKVFYGWRMVAAACFLQFLQAALMMQAFGAYFAVLSAEFGWSKTALSGAAVMQPLEAAILGPLLGWLIDRFGPQRMIRAGVFCMGAGLIAFSQINTLLGFYAAFTLIAFGTSLAGFFTLSVAIIHWFEKKRARALSMLSFGLAVGGMATPLIALSIERFGWRNSALVSGLLLVVAAWPLTRIFRRHPAEVGETIDGLPPMQLTANSSSEPPQREFSVREAINTRAFWLLSIGHSLALVTVYTVNVHAITHMKEGLGYSLAQASLFMMLMTGGQLLGVLLGWLIGDRYDKRRVASVCMLLHASGLLMLTYAVNSGMLVAFAALHGIAWGLRGPFMQALRADYFGRKSIGMILGLSSLITVIGQIGGPMIAAAFADATGNYRMGFTVLAVIIGLGSLSFLLARRPL